MSKSMLVATYAALLESENLLRDMINEHAVPNSEMDCFRAMESLKRIREEVISQMKAAGIDDSE